MTTRSCGELSWGPVKTIESSSNSFGGSFMAEWLTTRMEHEYDLYF